MRLRKRQELNGPVPSRQSQLRIFGRYCSGRVHFPVMEQRLYRVICGPGGGPLSSRASRTDPSAYVAMRCRRQREWWPVLA